MHVNLDDIRCDYRGFQRLIELADTTSQLAFDELILDMSQATWFDANMSAPLGAILYRIGRRVNSVTPTNVSPRVNQILRKNGFLSVYGQEKVPDTNETTIEYRRFETKDDRFFATYIENNFVGKGLPAMSEGLHKRLRESIFEIFSNAVIHSETRYGIFACGQFFPTKNYLNFSIADLGIGIRQNIKNSLGLDMPADEAIKWATEDSNTTKTGSIPGGLGLKLLSEFITQNKGSIQIVSDRGYWQLLGGRVTTNKFKCPFPGTVVNIRINTADTSAYCLVSEITADNIF